MFRRILPFTVIVAVSMGGCAVQNSASIRGRSNARLAIGSVHTVRTTAYTCSEPGGAHSAVGTRLCDTNTKGRIKSAASDWSRYPLGTEFKIVSTGEVYEICDYGSALVGKNTIDLYKSSRHEMRRWGARYVEIKILRWGSPEKSRKVLAPRTRYSHVRMMLASLQGQN
ncbi:MAG TPA: 3D domain-containing protein [Chthoniobacteraceae bacterium]|nr:3D domain-containing protein [Chthoniobacteraceae bacterium]